MTAIVLAVIILGLATLLTTATITEVRSPDDPTTDVTELDRIALDIERGAAGLAGHINADGPHSSVEAVNTSLAASFDTYDSYLYEAMADRRATLGTIDFQEIVAVGSHLIDSNRSNSIAFDGSDDAVIIDPADSAPLAFLELSVALDSLGETPEDTLEVVITGEDRTNHVLLYDQPTDGPTIELRDDTGESIETITCEGGPYLDLHLIELDGVSADCQLDPFTGLSPIDETGYGLTIRNGSTVSGGLQLIAGAPPERLDHIDETSTTGSVSPIAWSIELGLTQSARAGERQVSTTIEVYNHPASIEASEVSWG